MASILTNFPGACCTDIQYFPDRIECAPKLREDQLRTGLTNHCYDFRCLITGEAGETVKLIAHWPRYDMDKVDHVKHVYWFVQSFYNVAWKAVYTSEDGLEWTRLPDVPHENFDLFITVTLPESGKLYVSVNLPFTLEALEQICEKFAPWRIRLGKTIGGNDLPIFRFGTGDKVIWLQANQHVNEVCGCHTLASLMEVLADPATDLTGFTFYVLPSVSVEKMDRTLSLPPMDHDINRDWFLREHPEVIACHNELQRLQAEGKRLLVMIDMHNGWCRASDSGGNITEFNRGFVEDDYRNRRLRFTRAMLASCDYEDPDKIWWCDVTGTGTFFQYGSQTYESLCYTYEFSRFALYDREAGAYVPLTQEGLRRFGRQFARFLLEYDYDTDC